MQASTIEPMQDWLAAQARARPDGLALVAGNRQLTYRVLNQQVAHVAAHLVALGITRGVQVGVLLSNSPEAVLIIHAAARLGCVLVMLHTRLTATELDNLLSQTACKLLLYDRETAPLARALQSPLLQRVAVQPIDAQDAAPVLPMWDSSTPAAAYLDGSIQPAAPFAVFFTSGSSGTPKGVVLSYHNIFFSALASAYRIGVLPDDRWLCVLPLYHIGGLSIVMRSCLYGTTMDLWQRFDPQALAAALAHEPVTLLSLVPTMLVRLLDTGMPSGAPRALRLVLLGGAAATPELIEQAQRSGWPIATTYGLTEAASQVATALPADVQRKPGSVGKPLLFTRVRICDQDGQECAPGTYGEMMVSGPTVMRGYIHQLPEQQSEHLPRTAPAADDWFATGDIGTLDEEGDIWLIQRRSDVIISGGENIYPAEIEAVLRRHPAVAEVAVGGRDSPEWGQHVAAAIVRRDPSVTAEDIRAFCRAYLARYKQPRQICFVAQLPRTAAGKLHRPALRDLFATCGEHA